MSRTGIVDTASLALERILPDEVYAIWFPDGAPEGKHTVAVPDGYPEGGKAWDEIAGAFVDDWTLGDAYYHSIIDRRAGKFRKRFITDAPGQEMTYLQKRLEAEALAAGAPQEDCPMLVAEAAVMGGSVAQLAATVLANAAVWAELGAQIEALRMQAKKAVTEATTAAAKLAATDVDWSAALP